MIETQLAFIILFSFYSGRGGHRGQFFQAYTSIFGTSERLQIDQSSDAQTIRGDIAKRFALIDFANDAVDGLISALFGKMGASPIEEFHQLQPDRYVLLSRAIGIKI